MDLIAEVERAAADPRMNLALRRAILRATFKDSDDECVGV
jgi:hypothetical protein